MRTMKQLLQVFGLFLALAWVPITSHCTWESLIGGGLFACEPATEKGDCSSDEDNCVAVESGSYKMSSTRLEIPAPSFPVEFIPGPVLAALHSLPVAPPTAARPEIPVCWQFISRTALPPRAPSLVS